MCVVRITFYKKQIPLSLLFCFLFLHRVHLIFHDGVRAKEAAGIKLIVTPDHWYRSTHAESCDIQGLGRLSFLKVSGRRTLGRVRKNVYPYSPNHQAHTFSLSNYCRTDFKSIHLYLSAKYIWVGGWVGVQIGVNIHTPLIPIFHKPELVNTNNDSRALVKPNHHKNLRGRPALEVEESKAINQ